MRRTAEDDGVEVRVYRRPWAPRFPQAAAEYDLSPFGFDRTWAFCDRHIVVAVVRPAEPEETLPAAVAHATELAERWSGWRAPPVEEDVDRLLRIGQRLAQEQGPRRPESGS